ncbi:MAG: T9SS type A sorting domain-containing protein [Chitinophagaceae bacterium]
MKNVLLLFMLIFPFFHSGAQFISSGQCGLQYTYDAAGNLISRQYVCINGPEVIQRSTGQKQKESGTVYTQQIEALYPNPTTGRFTVRFTLPLEDAIVRISDLNGRVLQQYKVSGALIQCNISQVAPGFYYIQVVDKNTNLLQKVIKQ